MTGRPLVGIIGAGALGTALGPALAGAGYTVVAVASRDDASAEALARCLPGCRATTAQGVAEAAELVFLTTPDDAVGPTAASLRWRPGRAAIHCSGSLTMAPLATAAAQGARVGSLHPLQAFAERGRPELATGIAWALEATPPLDATLRQLVNDLKGWIIAVTPEQRILYHAGTILACNYLVTLVKLATDLWEPLGMGRRQAVRTLLPLLRVTLDNIERTGYPNCLTGPLSRGDGGVVQRHLEAIGQVAPQAAATYRALGLATLPIARAKGRLGPEQEEKLRVLLAGVSGDTER
ncbi:MAG: DUF2520 domain-containing protein [Dehalococcoidia bacterium]|nr:DUF2520 domain-containing protein [Dehalococcoidia bacterium]